MRQVKSHIDLPSELMQPIDVSGISGNSSNKQMESLEAKSGLLRVIEDW